MGYFNLLFALAAVSGALKLLEEDDLHLWQLPLAVLCYLLGRSMWRFAFGPSKPHHRVIETPAPQNTPPAPESETPAVLVWISVAGAVALATFLLLQTMQRQPKPARHWSDQFRTESKPASHPVLPPGFEMDR